MYKVFRIVCTVLSALFVGSVFLLGAFFGWIGALLGAAAALGFFGLAALFRSLQKKEEEKETPPEPRGDYLHPLDKE